MSEIETAISEVSTPHDDTTKIWRYCMDHLIPNEPIIITTNKTKCRVCRNIYNNRYYHEKAKLAVKAKKLADKTRQSADRVKRKKIPDDVKVAESSIKSAWRALLDFRRKIKDE